MMMKPPDLHQRRAGVLLHPTSLPSGVLDKDVEHWLQILAETGFSVWQVLPLCEPQKGLSPYQCCSTFAMNPCLLPELPLINESDAGFISFCEEQRFWLDDYALFNILKKQFHGISWCDWPDEWKLRQPGAMASAHQVYHHDLVALKWQQYQLYKRWQEIRKLASGKGILLFGDLPIFVGYDSADVWSHPEWFLLDEDRKMQFVAGVPPDYFSATGQRWGNPHYDWEAMQKDGFTWWKARICHHLEQFDVLRIDHFRGLEAVWMIDATCETAVEGHWQKVPGDDLLSSLKEYFERLPFVAEDLGIITPEVTALRKKYNLPGMSILQFGFDEFEDSPHKPKNIEVDKVVYTGTHDNDTTKGWFNSLDESVKKHVLEMLNIPATHPGMNDRDEGHGCWHDVGDVADTVVEKLIDNAMQSKASICIIPMQDCLHLDSKSRMNTPGTIEGNWQWKLQWDQVDPRHDASRVNNMRLRLEKAERLVSANG